MKTITTEELSIQYFSNLKSREIIDSFAENTLPIQTDINIMTALNAQMRSSDPETQLINFFKNFDTSYGYNSASIPLELQLYIQKVYNALPTQVKQKIKQEIKMGRIEQVGRNMCYSMYEDSFHDKSTVPSGDYETITDDLDQDQTLVPELALTNNKIINYTQNNINRKVFQKFETAQTINAPIITTSHSNKWMKDILYPGRINEIADTYISKYNTNGGLSVEQTTYIQFFNPYDSSENITATPINEVAEEGVRVTQLGRKLMTMQERKELLKKNQLTR